MSASDCARHPPRAHRSAAQDGRHERWHDRHRPARNDSRRACTRPGAATAHHGTLLVSIANRGPFPVTIESAALNPDPYLRAREPFRDDGTAAYWTAGRGPIGPWRPLAGIVLQPHQVIYVGLPLITAFCRIVSAGNIVLNQFWVTVRFLSWTHDVPISWTDPYSPDQGAIMAGSPSESGPPGLCHPQTAG